MIKFLEMALKRVSVWRKTAESEGGLCENVLFVDNGSDGEAQGGVIYCYSIARAHAYMTVDADVVSRFVNAK
jgi:hypothetical protein